MPERVSVFAFFGWLVGCFGFNGLLRQYFSLYRAVSQRQGERGEKGQMREKMSKQPPPAPTASATGPCPTIIRISRTPRHWKFTQHLRTTRPPYAFFGSNIDGSFTTTVSTFLSPFEKSNICRLRMKFILIENDITLESPQ